MATSENVSTDLESTQETKEQESILIELKSDAEVVKRRKRDNPYRPKLSTKVKWALEDATKNAVNAQRSLRKMIAWYRLEEAALAALEEEALAALEEEAITLSKVDYRMPAFIEKIRLRRLRLAELAPEIAALTIEITELERTVTTTLALSKNAVPSPADRAKGFMAGYDDRDDDDATRWASGVDEEEEEGDERPGGE